MASTDVQLIEGDFNWQVPSLDRTVQTHYYIHKPTSATTTSQPPLIIVHGGPGIPSIYLKTHEKLAALSDITVIFYDQIGCGKSTHLREKMGDQSFWTIDLFLDELRRIIEHLKLAQFDILGHSWGAMLAASYAIEHPKGLRKLVLASGLSKMQTWIDEANRLRKTLPADVQEVLDRCEREGKEESPEYEQAVMKYYALYLCRKQPFPEELVEAFKEVGKDPTTYFTMFGKNEFSCTGNLKSFDIVSELRKISVPTLVTNGRYDEATDAVVRPFFEHIPKVKWVQYSDSAHMSHAEESERYTEVLGGFLKM